MVIDTSALIAILQDEPEARVFVKAIDDAPVLLLSAASLLEASMIHCSCRGVDGSEGGAGSRRAHPYRRSATGRRSD